MSIHTSISVYNHLPIQFIAVRVVDQTVPAFSEPSQEMKDILVDMAIILNP
jgi:hypothetical protein